MHKVDEIYLDLDDVLNCFTGHVGCVFGLTANVNDLSWYAREFKYDVYSAVIHAMANRGIKLRLSPGDFWQTFREDFWAQCRVSDACYPLIAKCVEQVGERNVFIATSPTRCPMAASGKMRWINRYMPEWLTRQYFITPRKWKMAAPGRLLIDDSPENHRRWRMAGGEALLVPKPWTCENYEPNDEFHYLTQEIFN